MDVTAPGTLTAAALADAVAAVERHRGVRLAGGAAQRRGDRRPTSPTSTAPPLGRVRLLISAGAPVPAVAAARGAQVLPHAELHTPYGMTEALPVTDISLRRDRGRRARQRGLRRAAGAGGRASRLSPLDGRRLGPTAT